jgi:hypothetical protein
VSDAKPRPKAPAVPEVAKPIAPEPPKATPATPRVVRVQVRAAHGTLLLVDGKSVQPDAIIDRQVGELVVKFTCPAKKKFKPQPGTLRAQIPDSSAQVVVEVPCH